MEKKYVADYPNLMKQWDFEKNNALGIDPSKTAHKSNKKVWWLCSKGHSWNDTVSHRTAGRNCPYCSNHRVLSGYNDLESCCPYLLEEWNYEKNIDTYPSKLTIGSGKKIWWKCKKCKNEWQASINNRVGKGSGCPYCSNLKVKQGFNDLATTRPDLAKEWDYEKNGELKPEMITTFYSKKVWWKCQKCNNSWHISPNARSKSNCPYCANLKIKAGFNDLATTNPELLKEWDYEKNQGLLPSQVVRGSEKKVWWRCQPKGHSWSATINSRARGNKCPICSNQLVVQGSNDLFTTNPELYNEWDFEKNSKLSPYNLSSGSTKKVWWKCKNCNFSWQTSIYSRTIGHNCPVCGREKNTINRLKTVSARNSLVETYPELSKEWDYEKNSIDISLVSVNSNKKVWWVCSKEHSFQASVVSRTRNKSGCPYCNNQKVLTGINDLQSLNPTLADEWDYEKNYPLTPSDVFLHSSKYAWWKCRVCGNSWKAKINNRANNRNCPQCNFKGSSFVEQTIFFYVKKYFPDAVSRKHIGGFEFDIYIPSSNIAIEYDGAYFHSQKRAIQIEAKKNDFSKAQGLTLIRLRETPLNNSPNATNISCNCSNWDNLEITCEKLLKYLCAGEKFEISIRKDYSLIISLRKENAKKNSFAIHFPQLLKEWDYEKNESLLPEHFSRGSTVKVWWKCSKGHSWNTTIYNRCKGHNCPICAIKIRSEKRKRK